MGKSGKFTGREPDAVKSALAIAVVGSTGLVGREFIPLLKKSSLPVRELHLFSRKIDQKILSACDLIFFVSADSVSKKLAPALARKGAWVIDDSAAFRLDPVVPLVIPEVNANSLSPARRLIAGPNCTVTGLAVAGNAIHRLIGVREVRLASYQSVSGAGKAALHEFFSQVLGSVKRLRLAPESPAPIFSIPKGQILPAPIAFNVIPQVGGFDAEGISSEERKAAAELRKLWAAPHLKISATAVRTPVIRGHSLSVWLTLAKETPLSRIRDILKKTPGVVLQNSPYATPLSWAGRGPVAVSRLRRGTHSREICLWIVSDNLLKGAALNSIQIAEHLLKRGWLKARP